MMGDRKEPTPWDGSPKPPPPPKPPSADPTKDPAVVEAVLRWVCARSKTGEPPHMVFGPKTIGSLRKLADAVRDGQVKP